MAAVRLLRHWFDLDVLARVARLEFVRAWRLPVGDGLVLNELL